MGKRRNRPMFLIDIAVPRNIDPAVNELDSVFLYDIDDLGKVVDDNKKGRIETAKEAEEIVREEVDRMVLRLKTREAGARHRHAAGTIRDLAQGRDRAAAPEAGRADAAAGRSHPRHHARSHEQVRSPDHLRAQTAHGGRVIVIGSRGSKLALWQAEHIAANSSRRSGVETRIEIIKTSGDKIQDVPLAQVGGKGTLHQGNRRSAAERRDRPGRAQHEGRAHRASCRA